MDFQVADFGKYSGATAGTIVGDRWEYPVIGYNFAEGSFYVGEDQREGLVIVPFAIRQCKEVEDLNGVIRRYPTKTRRADMIDGKVKQRVQVMGLVDGELHIVGARSWTARAAWLNPRSGQYHDDKFEVGLWYRLEDYIKAVKAEKGITTAPLCYELTLGTGAAIELVSASNAKNKSKGVPIVAKAIRFVGAEQAAANEALFVAEDIADWVAEWNTGSVQQSADNTPAEPVENAVEEFEGLAF